MILNQFLNNFKPNLINFVYNFIKFNLKKKLKILNNYEKCTELNLKKMFVRRNCKNIKKIFGQPFLG